MRRLAPAAVGRVRAELGDPLMRSAYSLMLNSVATALLGLVFWVLAARLRDSAQVGQDSALIASMMTLSSIFQLNLANTVTRFLPQAGPRTRRWVLSAYAIAAMATLAGALAFVLLAPTWSQRLSFVRKDTLLAVAFVLATTLWSIFGLQDAVLTALRRAPWVPLENAIFGVLKIAFLPALAAFALTHAVFVSWTLPMVLLLAPVNYLIFARFIGAHVRRHREARPVAELLPSHRVRRFLVADYLGSVAQQAALALPALIVIGLLGSSANAYFYVPFMLVTSFDTLFFNASVSLVVEGAFESAGAAALVRRVVSRVGRLVLPGVLLMVLGAPLLLLPFGSGYSAHGATAMRLLALASVFRIAISLFAAVCRIEGRGGAILAAYAAVVALLVPLLLVLSPSLGIEGAALGWLLANALVASAAAPALVRLLRPGELASSQREPGRRGWVAALPMAVRRDPVSPLCLVARRAATWVTRLRAERRNAPPRRGTGVRWRTMALLGELASAAAVPAAFGLAPSGIRFGVLLVFVCVAPGTALLGALEPAVERVSPVAVLAGGLALGALAAELLLLLGAWWPVATTVLAALSCLLVLVRMQARRR